MLEHLQTIDKPNFTQIVGADLVSARVVISIILYLREDTRSSPTLLKQNFVIILKMLAHLMFILFNNIRCFFCSVCHFSEVVGIFYCCNTLVHIADYPGFLRLRQSKWKHVSFYYIFFFFV